MITVRAHGFCIEIDGHAGQNITGRDIVCASASTLAYTLAQMVVAMKHQGKLKKEPVVEITGGKATIRCEPKKMYRKEVEQTYFVVQTGFELLAHNYPKYLVIRRKP